MDEDNYDSYIDLLNGKSPGYGEDTQYDDTTASFEIPVEAQRKAPRKGNFSRDEDIIIVKSWLNTSKDPIVGNEQKSKRFWGKIFDLFKTNGGEIGRSEKSVKNRYQDINRLCIKFGSCVKQIDNRHQSGQSTHGKLIEAKQLYIANEGRAFHLEHCYELLKDEKKWHDSHTSTTKKSSSFVDLDGDAFSLGNSTDPSTNNNRPTGRKAAKEKMSRKKANIQTGSSSTMSVTDERWQQKMENENRKFEQRNRMIKENEQSRELQIMEKNTEGMDPVNAGYWNDKKNEILRKNGLL